MTQFGAGHVNKQSKKAGMMTKQSKSLGWIVTAIIFISATIWGASAIASTVTENTEDIACVSAESKDTTEEVAENSTKIILMETRIDEIDKRLERLEDMASMIQDIHDAVVGGD